MHDDQTAQASRARAERMANSLRSRRLATTVNGLPALENSGKTRFEGFDLATDLRLTHSNYARATYSFHNGRYVDFVKNVDAGPTQLGGNRFEMSARQLAAFGFVHSAATGLVGSVTVKY